MLDMRLQAFIDCSNYTFPSLLFFYVPIDSVLNKILSSEAKCHCSSNSSNWISSSLFSNSTVRSVLLRSISETPTKSGLLSSITHPSGETEVSQPVKAYKRINGFIGRNTAGQMDLDFHFGGGIVLYFFDFYFSLYHSLSELYQSATKY